MKNELSPGDTVCQVRRNYDGWPVLMTAQFVVRRGSWRTYRNLDGSTWKEAGEHWWVSRERAIREFLAVWHYGPAEIAAILEPNPEKRFRVGVAVHALLWLEWQRRKAVDDPVKAFALAALEGDPAARDAIRDILKA